VREREAEIFHKIDRRGHNKITLARIKPQEIKKKFKKKMANICLLPPHYAFSTYIWVETSPMQSMSTLNLLANWNRVTQKIDIYA